MRFLFVHQNFPGQFRHIARTLADDHQHEVVGIIDAGNIRPGRKWHPRIELQTYPTPRPGNPQTHPYLRDHESHVRRGQQVVRAAIALRSRGFSPDVVVVHPGWGEGLFLHEVFPLARHVHYCEYFYHADGADVGFDPEFPANLDDRLRVSVKNSTQLLSLSHCNVAVSPTRWQRSRYPLQWQEQISILHEGIDTAVVRPDSRAVLEVDGHSFHAGEPVVTFAARNLEPYRGFHTFIRALPTLQARCPAARVIIAGGDDISYGRRLPAGESYRQKYCKEVEGQVDWARVHFVGKLPSGDYLRLLQVSAVHVYLTYPFVLSWSMLEAMASGCLVIGSATAPVQDVITQGENGLLADFFDAAQLAQQVADVLASPQNFMQLRQQARRYIQQNYDLEARCLPAWRDFLLTQGLQRHMPVTGPMRPAPDLNTRVEAAYAQGNRLHRAGKFAEAEQIYTAVLDLAPGHTGARGDRGNARAEQGRVADAETDFRAILKARPEYYRALQSLGNLLRRCGRLEEAADCLRRSLADKATASVHWDLAYTLLLMGHYREAWPHFEHRHAALGLRTPDAAKPRWDGKTVLDAVLLVLDEQGIGDTLQFLRFLQAIPVGDGGRVIFAGKPETLSVVRRILPAGDVFRWDEPLPHSQSWVGLMSLPARLGIMKPAQLPPPASHSLVEPERLARWRPLVRGKDHQPVVCLCWRGNPAFKGDAWRSPGLAALLPVLAVEGVRFVSVQVGAGRAEISELGLQDRMADVGAPIEANGSDLLDTLAVLESCDFVISSCTSVAHIAGLAGLPGYVLLSSRPDWRWLIGRSDSPWYPSLTLIRQPVEGDWATVAREAAARLVAWRDKVKRQESS